MEIQKDILRKKKTVLGCKCEIRRKDPHEYIKKCPYNKTNRMKRAGEHFKLQLSPIPPDLEFICCGSEYVCKGLDEEKNELIIVPKCKCIRNCYKYSE